MSINPPKRSLRDWDFTPSSGLDQHGHKRQRHTILPAFWDNLSNIHLTKSALQELDRRSAASTKPDRNFEVAITDTIIDIHTLQYKARADKNLRRFARQGGPDMSGARESAPVKKSRRTRNPRVQNPTPTSTQALLETSSTRTETTSTRSSGPYDRNFQQHLTDNNIYYDKYKHPDGGVPPRPSNWKAINEQIRVALAPNSRIPAEEFRRFAKADAGAFKEAQVVRSVIPIIEGPIREKDPKCTSGHIPFLNLEPLTDGSIAPGSPDTYYGARPEQLDRPVREQLGDFIIPTTQVDLPICPNFFVEVKGPDGSLAVAMRQALYDGALGARGMHHLRAYGHKRPPYDNHASTITSIYHGGTLKMYTVHCAEPVDPVGQPSYIMHQLGAWALTGNKEIYAIGVLTYRALNAWAERERNGAIDNANKVIRGSVGKLAVPTTPRTATQPPKEITESRSIAQSSSSESAPYTTPPTTSFGMGPPFREALPSADNKRTRQQAQGSSPMQQTKRNRVQHSYNPPLPPCGNTISEDALSFQLGDSKLGQEHDDSDTETEPINSDEDPSAS